MRADRLVALLLLLQRRGQITAAEAASELEVSERTARRDFEALGMAGLPVFSLRGRNGGWTLAGGGRTDLSGLNEREVRTLFLLMGPSSSASPELRAALRKLTRALPESFKATAEAAAKAVVVDRSGWDGDGRPRAEPPHLDHAQKAVVEGRQAVLGYVASNGEATTRTVHPLGLAAKGSIWYLLAGTERGQRTFRVDRVASFELTNDRVIRPEDFDLAQAWQSVTADVERWRAPVRARTMISSEVLPIVRWVFGRRVSIGPAAPDGRIEVEIRSASVRSLAGEIAGFGDAAEVLEPAEVREHLADIASQLRQLYAQK